MRRDLAQSLLQPLANFDLSNLNERVSSSDWLLVSARYLNRAGFISGQVVNTVTGEPVTDAEWAIVCKQGGVPG
jgi:hypothetical protein